MSIQSAGLQAYVNAVSEFNKARTSFEQATPQLPPKAATPETSFAETLQDSLASVNDLQSTKAQMIKSFASGETQNVHELMITLQKAGLAVNMTSAVRNKVLEAYRELSRLQF